MRWGETTSKPKPLPEPVPLRQYITELQAHAKRYGDATVVIPVSRLDEIAALFEPTKLAIWHSDFTIA